MARSGGRPPWWAIAGTAAWVVLLSVVVVLVVRRGEPSARADADPNPVVPSVSAAGRPVVTYIGDSWTEGVGATAGRGYAWQTGEQQGWECYVLGVGGSGYVVAGYGRPYAERIDLAVATAPDVIVVQGSINEAPTPPDVLALTATQTLTRLRAEAGPETDVLVVGASYTPGLPAATVDAINGAIAAAAGTAGLRFVNPAAELWVDPADPAVWADAVHPNDAGHALIADRMELLLAEVLQH
jgi:lysophospholipase L1-like esterase